MDLSKILSIAGRPGLFQIVNQSRGGVVVSSLLDGKKMAVGQTQRVSTLSDISIYTIEGDEPLSSIFQKIFEHTGGEEVELNLNDKNALRNYFLEILPDHDEERVYVSDIKKMMKWFNLLLSKDLLSFEDSETPDEKNIEEIPEDSSSNAGVNNETTPDPK